MISTQEKALANAVSCRVGEGLELVASLLSATRFQVVFELHAPSFEIRMSEVLPELKVCIAGRPVYNGRAVVSKLINKGEALICEATLQQAWVEGGIPPLTAGQGQLRAGFEEFMQQWQKNYRIRPDYKLVVADMQCWLTDLKLWSEHLEIGFSSLPPAERLGLEREVVCELAESTTPVLNLLFEKFEETCRRIDPELEPAHEAYCRRQLHPLLMASPFMHRIFTKPLGYAGDYEMVNMIVRDPCEGGSLFAKLLNVFILSQVPAVAHRNRVTYLTGKLAEETQRCRLNGKQARILNFGCGPAREAQDFLAENSLSDNAAIDLLDFDDEALAYVARVLGDIKSEHRRRTMLKPVKKSVQQVLRHVGRPAQEREEYDFIYCAGLFDYLNNRTCRNLVAHFYDHLAPGGLLVATNVELQHPIRKIMEHIYEWRLIYRDAKGLAALGSSLPPADSVSVRTEAAAGNIFLEVRKT
jgi:extracellular factor (EF) 3-hydroxypalmitic acid methyl ester biosynthesis protein